MTLDRVLDMVFVVLLLVDIFVMHVHRNAHKQYVRGFCDGMEHCTDRLYETAKRHGESS